MALEKVDQYPFPRDGECPFQPSPEYARRRAEEPVSRVRTGTGNDPWLITRFQDAVAVLGNPGVFRSNPTLPGYPRRGGHTDLLVGKFLFAQDPPTHTRLRSVLVEEFSVRRVVAHAEMVSRVVSETLDDFVRARSEGDLVADVAFRIPGRVMFEVLGMPHEDREQFLTWITRCLGPVGLVTEGEAAAAVASYQAYVDDFLTFREQNPSDDVIGRLVTNALEPGIVSRDELLFLIQALITGGFDTTAHTMGLGVLALLRNPDQLDLLRNDTSLAPKVAEEVLRTTAVTHVGRRRVAVEDIEVGGTLIRSGEGVIVSQDAVNRDEAIFTDPHEFNIERDGARRHMTFGFGIHLCVGSPLARMELRELFAQLFARIPTLELARPNDEDPYVRDATMWGLERLDVRW